MSDRIEATIKAIEKAGGAAALAKKLLPGDHAKEDYKKMQWRIAKWKEEGVPPKWVIPVENESGVSRHKLAPDIYPASKQKSEAA